MFLERPRPQKFDLNAWARLLFAFLLSTAVSAKYGSSLVIEPANVIVRNGTVLKLKCSLTGPATVGQVSAENLTWWHNGIWLTSNTHVLDNKTIQLSITSASWENAGQYCCKLRSTDKSFISAVNASVTIGDVPGKPQIVRWENLEWYLKLYWKAPTYDGRLKLTYSLKRRGCKSFDCGFTPMNNQPHKNGLYSMVYSVALYKHYNNVYIEAQNALGTSKSDPVDIYLIPDIDTVHACPPNIISTRGQSRAIEVQLGKRDSDICDFGEYKQHLINISYWTRESSHFESKLIGPTTQRVLTLEPLKPFTQYNLNVSVQLLEKDLQRSIPSSVVGPFTANTSEDAPSEGPTSLVCYSTIWPNNRRRMNITIKWKPPPYNKRNGIIRRYKLSYGYQELITKNLTVSSVFTREFVLPDLNAHYVYHLFLQACTFGKACSSSKQCTVVPAEDKNPVSKSRRPMEFVIPGVVTVLLFVAVSVFYLWKKEKLCIRRRTSRPPPIDEWTRDVMPHQNERTDQSSTSSDEPYYCYVGQSLEESKKGLLVDINSN